MARPLCSQTRRMSYRGIKRLLGESSLERKIQLMFATCLLLLIAGSFLWVNQITEDLIDRNTRDLANVLTSDYILRTHLRNIQPFYSDDNPLEDEQAASVLTFQSLSTEPASIPYDAELVTMGKSGARNHATPILSTDEAERERIERIYEVAIREQQEQNRLETIRQISNEAYQKAVAESEQAARALDEEEPDQRQVFFSTRTDYYYYAPLVFKSNSLCLSCHYPVTDDDQSRLAEVQRKIADPDITEEQELELELERLNLGAPMFVRITLDNSVAQSAVTKSRAILISVAIVAAVLSVGMLWTIVRYVIVKPLAHLKDVTEAIGKGRNDVRAKLNTGDEFEELARSFNRMIRRMQETQSKMQETNADLDRKVSEQAQLNLKLHEMNQIKSEFLANMSHELRTPLNSIIGFSELLEIAQGLDDKQVRFASNIRKSGNLLLDLINDILDLAKLEAGKMEVRLSEFQITNLISRLCEMVQHLADQKNIRLIYDADQAFPPVISDRIKIQQILTNLLSNAIKFTPEGGRITVGVCETIVEEGDTKEPMLTIEVEDTGIGIAAPDQAIVFEKFRQGPSATGGDSLTREVSGTGLGLSIVKELSILLGGNIELESEVGRGSVFTVAIPWVYRGSQKIDSELSEQLNEITKTARVDLDRVTQTPVPPVTDEE